MNCTSNHSIWKSWSRLSFFYIPNILIFIPNPNMSSSEISPASSLPPPHLHGPSVVQSSGISWLYYFLLVFTVSSSPIILPLEYPNHSAILLFPPLNTSGGSPFPTWKRLTYLWANNPRSLQSALQPAFLTLLPASPFFLEPHEALCNFLYRIPFRALLHSQPSGPLARADSSWFSSCLTLGTFLSPHRCEYPSLVYALPLWGNQLCKAHVILDDTCLSVFSLTRCFCGQ